MIGNEVVAAVFPDHLPGTDGARLGAAYFFVAELYHPALVDGREQGVHTVRQLLVGALGAAIDIDLALELAAFVMGGEALQLFDELVVPGSCTHRPSHHGSQ